MIIPSIDLMDGKVVQLEQGKKKKIELNNAVEIAEKFKKFKEVQVIDLDAAMGNGNNKKIISELCQIVNARVGGGIRNSVIANEIMDMGAKKIIIGTKANRDFLQKLNEFIPKEKIICAIDAWKTKIVINGWKEKTNKSIFEKVKEIEDYCSEFLFTAVEKEGLMKDIDFDTVKKLCQLTENRIIYAGGVSTNQEIKMLEELNVDCVIGMAIYTNKIEVKNYE